jgi:hypothetical protein
VGDEDLEEAVLSSIHQKAGTLSLSH